MANITIKIKLRDAVESQEFILGTNQSTKINNIGIKTDQYGTFDEIPSNLQGLKVLSFAKAKLRFNEQGIICNEDYQDGYLQSESEPLELVFGATDSNGNYSIELTISGDGVAGLTSFVVYGDNLANQFPTVASIDGVPFYSDDYKLVMPLTPNDTNSHTIIFTKWNRPNYNACLTLIRATQEYLTYTNTEIDSLQSIERSSVNNSEINYGSIANSGQFELIDEDGELKDLVNDGVLPNSNVNVQVVFNNKDLQYHISNDTNYDTTQGVFTMSLSNKIDALDTLTYEGFAYPETSMTLYQILYKVLYSLNGGIAYNVIYNDILSNRCMTPIGEKYIYEYLQMIEIEYPVIEYGYTYRQVLDDICKIAQLNLFVNKSNNYEFISARPLLLNGEIENALRVTKGTLKEEPNYELIVRNKYDAVEISENKVSVKLDINSLISTYNSNETSYITSFNSDDKSDLITGYYYCAYVKASYYTMTINIPKKINNNLITIESISNKVDDYGNSNIKYNVKYSHQTGNVIFTELPYFVSVSDMFKPNYTSNVNGSGSLANYSNIEETVYYSTIGTHTASVQDETNLKILDVIDNDIYFTIIAKVLVGYERYKGVATQSTGQIISGTDSAEKYTPQIVEISIYGNQQIISFENTSVSSSNINTAQTKANVGGTSTKLLQDKCTFNGKKISTIIKDNILNDYKYGISNLRLEMFTTDLATKDGTIVKHLDNGDVLDNGDIVFLTGDKDNKNEQRYWCVYNNEYNYDGTLDESVILNQKREYYGLYNEKYFIGWNALIDSNDLIIETISNNKHLYTTNENLILNGKLVISNEENIKYIGKYVNNTAYGFIGCIKLEEVILPQTITTISNKAFEGCSNLKSIYISSSVEIISPSSFKDCVDLTSIYIPNSVILIGNAPFYNCSSSLIIYCECEEEDKPSGWVSNWNYYDDTHTLTVKWGYTRKEYEEEISSNT